MASVGGDGVRYEPGTDLATVTVEATCDAWDPQWSHRLSRRSTTYSTIARSGVAHDRSTQSPARCTRRHRAWATSALVGTDGTTEAATGLIGGSTDLATSESIIVADHDDSDLADAVTLEAWVRPDVVHMAAGRHAVTKSSASFIHTMRDYADVAQFLVRLGAPVDERRATGGGDVITEGAWMFGPSTETCPYLRVGGSS